MPKTTTGHLEIIYKLIKNNNLKIGDPVCGFTEPGLTWDKFQFYQIYRGNTPVMRIGEKPVSGPVEAGKYRNPIKRALYYQQLLDEGVVNSQTELAAHAGVVRARIGHFMSLLKLNDEIKEFMRSLDDTDVRLKVLNERRLRPIAQVEDREVQRERFADLCGEICEDPSS